MKKRRLKKEFIEIFGRLATGTFVLVKERLMRREEKNIMEDDFASKEIENIVYGGEEVKQKEPNGSCPYRGISCDFCNADCKQRSYESP